MNENADDIAFIHTNSSTHQFGALVEERGGEAVEEFNEGDEGAMAEVELEGMSLTMTMIVQ